MVTRCLALLSLLLFFSGIVALAVAPIPVTAPANYWSEPVKLPFDEEIITQRQEYGWHWTELRYTSLRYGGEAIRIHAVYAVPNGADAAHKVPAIIATHGDYGAALQPAYFDLISRYAGAGYAVLFYDWNPDFAFNWQPQTPNERKKFSTFGKLNYFMWDANYWLPGNDWKDSLPYQAVMAGRRGISWLQTRPEVDGDKIGVTGASYAGLFSALLAAIDPRIKAANACDFAAGVAPKEYDFSPVSRQSLIQLRAKSGSAPREEYGNYLPEWTPQQVATWRTHFDVQALLAHRAVPILYTITTNDWHYVLTDMMQTFSAMRQPKHLLIAPNRNHGYTDLPQTISFFDAVLQGKGTRPSISELVVKNGLFDGTASVKVTGEHIASVEIFFTEYFEIDPDRGASAVPAPMWRWVGVNATPGEAGHYTASWQLPSPEPLPFAAYFLRWRAEDVLNPKQRDSFITDLPAERKHALLRAFARVTDVNGVMECSAISDPVEVINTFNGGSQCAVPSTLDGAVRVNMLSTIHIDSEVPAGQPMATFNLPLPLKAVGTHGFVLWNWRAEGGEPVVAQFRETASPTKKILAPFLDTVKERSFQVPSNLVEISNSGVIDFTVNGKPDRLPVKGHGWHGTVPSGLGGMEELPIKTTDGKEHRLTFVISASSSGACNARVSLVDDQCRETVVIFRQTADADHIFQFHFTGKATLRVQITSQPENPRYMQVGPSALFLD